MKLAPLLLAMLLAGCLSFSPQQPSTTFSAAASKPAVFLGYDYGAATREDGAPGNFSVDVDAASNTGSAVAAFRVDGKAWEVTFSRFAQSAPFHEGGVRNAFHEHGASGNGDPNLPEFRAFSAGWGFGTVTVDGTPYPDPLTGTPEFKLHYMVAADAPRHPTDLRVTKKDGNTIYDPKTPADGQVFPNVPMVLLNVQTTYNGTVPSDNATTLADTVVGPDYSNQVPFEVGVASAHAMANFTVRNPTPGPTLGQLTFTVLDPEGSAAGSWMYDPAAGLQGPSEGSVDLPPPLVPGNYTVQVTGSGVQAMFEVHVAVHYEPALFLHVVYTQVDRLSDPHLVDKV